MRKSNNHAPGDSVPHHDGLSAEAYPAITFVLPVFNGQSTLGNCIDSILSQTIHGWKLLAIDDGSTDGSGEFLKSLNDPRISVLKSKSNRGLYPSLNIAISQVRTEWISLIFQDDELMPTYLDDFLALSIQNPSVDLFWSEVKIYLESGDRVIDGIDTHRQELIQPSQLVWESVLERGTIWTISGSFSRTRILRDLGFREDLPHCADFEFLLRAVRVSTFLYYEHPLVTIRIHEGQASARNLTALVDMRERLVIFSEQLRMFEPAQEARWRIAGRLLWGGLARVIGSLKRMNLRTGATAAWLTIRSVMTVLTIIPSPQRSHMERRH
jgi:glycosyltransferase involved in cell wall biosynthesis